MAPVNLPLSYVARHLRQRVAQVPEEVRTTNELLPQRASLLSTLGEHRPGPG